MDPDLDLALELADTAVEIAVPRFEDRDFTVTIKPDGSPVTSVDYAVERALRDRIARQRPDHAILGEEHGRSGDSEWCWYLDPIDGTSRFVSGDPDWMTFVALGRGADIDRRCHRGAGALRALVGRPWRGRVSRRPADRGVAHGQGGGRDRQ
jgi:histidinol-phosphatase